MLTIGSTGKYIKSLMNADYPAYDVQDYLVLSVRIEFVILSMSTSTRIHLQQGQSRQAYPSGDQLSSWVCY